ncbi:MAG: type III-B CRISPR module RAMP protein Cmr1 [Gammaproteobacteria bacterium]|nr:type III-B CRISPR module RAMP protein Cmr1 [Gammaproteobacteria bacterium]
MKTITATYKIVTPMFISGADQTKAELRIPSIKGAIRFWWRALNGCQYKTTEALYAAEAKIFGGTYQDEKNKTIAIQSTILFSFDKKQESLLSKDTKYKENYSNHKAIVYLAGQGVANETQYLLNTKFTLCLKSKSAIHPTVINAITLWGLLGGLGERSRKGFGSVAIQSIKNDIHSELFNFATVDVYKNKILSLLESSDYASLATPHQYSAFSQHAKLHISTALKPKDLAHIDIAEHYQKCRKGNDKLNEKHDKRIAFGQSKPRQASPLFLHIHPINGEFCNVRLYLPDNNIKDKTYLYSFLTFDHTSSIINE